MDGVPELAAAPLSVPEESRIVRTEAVYASGDAYRVNGNGSDDEEDDGNEEDWEEMEKLPVENATCLFCDLSSPVEEILLHCQREHQVDLQMWVRERRIPTEEIIRLVNYLRQKKISPEKLRESSMDSSLWNDDSFMKPALETDHLLVSALIWDWDEPDPTAEPFPEPKDEFGNRGGNAGKPKSKNESAEDRDRSYFDSYSGFNIHCEMLRDAIRTQSYQRSIKRLAADKIVLDIGCGTGVLSCFAAKAGARRVVAVDQADIIREAAAAARENKVDDKISFIRGNLDTVRLPERQVDLIVSEWMGYFLLFEGMLDCVLSARDRYLAPGGKMIPCSTSLFVCAISDLEAHEKAVSVWDDAYGLKFPFLKEYNLRHPAVEVVPPEFVVTNRALLRHWDLMKCSIGETNFETEVELLPTKDCLITALVGFFDVSAPDGPEGSEQIMFCTSPNDPPTHWAQSVFYLDQPFAVVGGLPVKLWASVQRARTDHRGIDVSFRMTYQTADAKPKRWQQFYEL